MKYSTIDGAAILLLPITILILAIAAAYTLFTLFPAPNQPQPSRSFSSLGRRIIILGPSNSGKSTLAHAISKSRNIPAIYLDQLHHLPNSDWIPRSAEDFQRLHDEAIQASSWVMDGTYLGTFPQRLERATGVIVIEVSPWVSLWRYLRRCWYGQGRIGALEGGRDTVSWDMIRWIMVGTKARADRRRQIYDDAALPKVMLDGVSALAEFYRWNGLSR